MVTVAPSSGSPAGIMSTRAVDAMLKMFMIVQPMDKGTAALGRELCVNRKRLLCFESLLVDDHAMARALIREALTATFGVGCSRRSRHRTPGTGEISRSPAAAHRDGFLNARNERIGSGSSVNGAQPRCSHFDGHHRSLEPNWRKMRNRPELRVCAPRTKCNPWRAPATP